MYNNNTVYPQGTTIIAEYRPLLLATPTMYAAALEACDYIVILLYILNFSYVYIILYLCKSALSAY